MATLRYTCACTRYLSPTRAVGGTRDLRLPPARAHSAPTSPARWRSTTTSGTNSGTTDTAADTDRQQVSVTTTAPDQALQSDGAGAKRGSFLFRFNSLAESLKDARDWTASNAPKMDATSVAKLVSSLNLDLPRYQRLLRRRARAVKSSADAGIERLKRQQLEEKRARLRKKLESEEEISRETHDFGTAMMSTHDCIHNYYSSVSHLPRHNISTDVTTDIPRGREVTQANIVTQAMTQNGAESGATPEKQPVVTTDREAVARAAVGRRTRGLVSALKQATTDTSRLTRLEDLCLHLSQYTKFAKNVAIKEKVVPLLLKLRKSSDPAIAQYSLQALHLVGYVAGVKGRGIRILTIDGGGTRGLIALEMLRQIETAAGKPIHEMFDYICGVSTGALIAIMIGAFRRPVDECERLYQEFSREMFGRSRLMGASKLVTTHAYYDTQLWEKILQENIGYDTFIDTMKEERCPKLCVVSSLVNQTNMENYLFRNYTHATGVQSKYRGSIQHSMWEAIRASSAAPGYYEEYKTGQHIHQDGGLMTNNPGAIAIHECKLLWPNEDLQCVISVGTGRYRPTDDPAPSYRLKDKLLKVVQSATDTEAVHTILHDLLPPSTYFRFNPYLSDEFLLDEISESRWEMMNQDALMYCRKNEAKLQTAGRQLRLTKKPHQRAADWVRTATDRMS